MARIVLSNNTEWYQTIKDDYVNNNLKSDSLETCTFNMCCFKKVHVNNSNFYYEEDDFIACNGTLLYKCSFGEEALKLLLNDLRTQSIKDVRKSLVGTFAVIYKINNIICAFIDESGSYALHYFSDNDNYIVSNRYYNIQKCCNQPINKLAMKEIMCERCILDNQSVFENIYRLMGNEQLIINLDSNTFEVCKVELNKYNYEFSSFDDAVSQLSEKMAHYANLQNLISSKKIIFMTGGLDSRIILAADMNAGIRPALGNWQGSPILMNSKQEDLQITNNIAEGLNLKSLEFDISTEFEPISNELFDQIGEDALLYGGNRKWHSIFFEHKYDIYDFGFFGETIKGWDPLDAMYRTPFTLKEYVSFYLSRNTHNFVNDDSDIEYREYIFSKHLKICEEANIDINNLSREDCMFLYYVYRTHADTKRVNLVNYYGYSFNLLAQKDLIDLINQIPYEYKQNAKVNLATTKKLYPDLLKYNYYSHCAFMSLNESEMQLVSNKNTSHISMVKKVISSMMSEKLKKKLIKFVRNKSTQDVVLEYVKKSNSTNQNRVPFSIDENTFTYTADYNIYWGFVCMMRILNESA